MSDLVTQAAIDAASERVNRSPLNEDPLVPALNAAAPHIAAEALRQAARKLRADREAKQSGYVSREERDYLDGIEDAQETLELRADEIEAAAAFTEMVQLGQQIEGNK